MSMLNDRAAQRVADERSTMEALRQYGSQVLATALAELQKLRHDPMDVLTRAVQPVLWLLLFGEVMARVRDLSPGGLPYLDFLAAGILAQSVLFVAIFYGISAIWERDLGILQRYLVSPAPRSALAIGKALAASARALIQAAIVYLLALVLGVGISVTLVHVIGAIAVIVLGSGLFSTLSLIIACIVKTRERFMGIGQVLTMPIFFATVKLSRGGPHRVATSPTLIGAAMPILLVLLIFLVLTIMLPFAFGELMFASLGKLHLSADAALALLAVIFIGGFINIPVRSITRKQRAISHPLAAYGFADLLPELWTFRSQTVVAVNVGGCLVPAGLAFYEIAQLTLLDPRALLATAFGCVANILICYFLARPVAGIGIVMPALASPLVGAVTALIFAPSTAPPVAFIIGVVGPLLGADVLHLKDPELREVALVSVGGAGTFDGILLSGVIAAYLA